MSLADEAARQRFINDHSTNFSVIAPAGVGKTTAITRRIAKIIETSSIPLDHLVVVTYTEKAAKELKERTLQELSNREIIGVEQIFFGTIHALADRLLRQYGYDLGIDSDFIVEQNTNLLWEQFLGQYQFPLQINVPWNSFLTPEMVFNLVKRYPNEPFSATESIKFPESINWEALLNYNATKNENIQKFQRNLRRWINEPGLHFPELQTTAKEFISLYEDITHPINEACSAYLSNQCNQLAQQFLQFRIRQQRLFFDDLIEQALRLVQISPALKNYYIILDEAQDTDPKQFQFLENFASPGENLFPLPGHFCLVGDPQQSIYNERADVHFYTSLHEKIINHGHALQFSVTMRFSQTIADYVTQLFAPILDGKNRQINFTPIRESLSKNQQGNWYKIDASDGDLDRLSTLFTNRNPADFGVKKWSDIAILCPRKIWLQEIQKHLSQYSIHSQLHSTAKRYGEFRGFAWIHALISYALDPNNKFELSGILREIFAYEDNALVDFPQREEISSQICELNTLATDIRQQSPLCALYTIEKRLHIHDRILSIQESSDDKIFETLKQCAKTSDSLIEMKAQLDILSGNFYETDAIDDNSLQLYTFHKSKGLEWPIVFIPFINREPYPAPKSYPDAVNHRIVFNKAHEKLYHDDEETNNWERLLYVALTRQKQNTIFIDDGTPPKPHSLKNLLDRDGKILGKLPAFEFLSGEANVTAHKETTFRVSEPNLKLYPIIRPSQNNTSLITLHPRCTDPQKYGTWWHSVMAYCPFNGDYRSYLFEQIKDAPDQNLAKNDIKLLLQNDQIWRKFHAARKIFKEFPFSMQRGKIITEGRIDVILFYDSGTVEIIDWKTENIPPKIAQKHFSAQLSAYKTAIQQNFTNVTNCAMFVYLTASGELVSTPEELVMIKD